MTNQQQTPREQRTPRYSVRLGRERIDEEHYFECWHIIRASADRFFSLIGERIVPPRGDTSGRRESGVHPADWRDVARWSFRWSEVTLTDGSCWEYRNNRQWICIRGPR